MPINAPARMFGRVWFWFSFSGVSVVFRGFRSVNTIAVIGRASRSVLPRNECRSGPCSVLGRLKNSMMKGWMSGAMLPIRRAGRLT